MFSDSTLPPACYQVIIETLFFSKKQRKIPSRWGGDRFAMESVGYDEGVAQVGLGNEDYDEVNDSLALFLVAVLTCVGQADVEVAASCQHGLVKRVSQQERSVDGVLVAVNQDVGKLGALSLDNGTLSAADGIRYFAQMLGVGAALWSNDSIFELLRNLPFLIILSVCCTPFPKSIYHRFLSKRPLAARIFSNALAVLSLVERT